MAHKFFNQSTANLIQELTHSHSHAILEKFPLSFTIYKHTPQQFPFYKRFFVDSTYKILIQGLLAQLSLEGNTSVLQPLLKQKIRSSLAQTGVQLKLKNNFLHKIQILDQFFVKGLFIHRNLNLPANCYSVENIDRNKKKKQFIYRLRSRLQREDLIQNLYKTKKLYEESPQRYFQFYLDGYDNFVETQSFVCQILAVYLEIEGQIVRKDGTVIQLPLKKDKPVSTHLLQIETPNIFGKNDYTRYLITDIDYFMKGNPFVQ